MMRWLSMQMAYEHVRAGFGRMVLSVLAVALGVALVVAIRLMNAAVLASFVDTIDAIAGRAALTVSAGEGLTFSEEVVQTLAAVPGVELAVPLVRAVAFPDDGSGELLTVHGVDLTHEAAVRVYHRADDPTEVIDDLLVFLAQPDSIVLGREFAERRGLAVGNQLHLVTPQGVKPFTVRGLLDPQGVARTLGGRLVVMDLLAAERSFTAPGQINQIDVLARPGAAVEGVKAAIAAVLPVGLKVEEPALRKGVIRKTISGFQTMLTGFGLLAVVAGFVICYSRLGAIFEQRTWEMGLLRAVGLRRSVVFVELLKESVLLGVLGALLGIPLGIVTARYGLPFVATAAALNFRISGLSATPAFTTPSLFLGSMVGVSGAVLAAVMPALRASRKEPIAALTMRGREDWIPTSPSRVYLPLVLLVASFVLAIVERISGVASLGIVTTGLVALAAGLSATLLIGRGGHLLTALWASVFGPTGEFAALHIMQTRRRASLTVATLGIGLGALLMFGILGWSFERSLVAQMTMRLRADLVVTSMFTSGGWISAPISEAVLEEMKQVPGVARAAGGQVKDIAHGGTGITLYGWDAPCFTDFEVCDWDLAAGALPDALQAVATGSGAIVSPSFANAFGDTPGDHIVLDSPLGPQRFIAAGITRTEPDTAVMISRAWLKGVWKDPQITWAYAKVDAQSQLVQVEEDLARRLGEKYRVQVRPVSKLIDYLAEQVHDAFHALYVVEGIALLLVLIGVGDLLTTGVLERGRQLATMRAIGLKRHQLFGMIVQEGAALGLFGLALAVLTGVALGLLWVKIHFPATLGWSFDFHIHLGLLVMTAGTTIVLCLLGSVLPALHAARLPLARALRND